MTTCDVAVIGAGPYALAAAAHLSRVKGLDVKVFGETMQFWKTSMPAGMLLRSGWSASHIADPATELTLDSYKIVSGNHLGAPIPLERFVQYGLWFQKNAVPFVDRRKVSQIDRTDRGFQLEMSDGETFHSRRVVVAAGIAAFASQPAQFERIPACLASHSSQHVDLARFSGKCVAVIGGGQSALESAALLHEAGADVEVIARQPGFHWLGWKERLQSLGPLWPLLYAQTDVGPAGLSRLVASPELVKRLPDGVRSKVRTICIRPAGAQWLYLRLRQARLTANRTVVSASVAGERLRLALDDGTERTVDHAILATGYRVNVERYPFLSASILRNLNLANGFPLLSSGLESSVAGLHFLGAPAAWSYGPLMYFVSGTKFAARSLMRHVATAAAAR